MRPTVKARIFSLLPLLVAVMLHGFVFNLRVPLPNASILDRSSRNLPKDIEVVLADRQLVFTHPADSDSVSGDKARFLSDRFNRIQREKRSPMTGRFSHGGGNLDSELATGSSRWSTLAATPDLLPDDLPLGGETLLNTDRYRYASFFHRVADTIYQPWVDRIEIARSQLSELGRSVESNLFVTRLAVTLNHEGEVIGVQLMSGSGVGAFDEAPKRAFWEVAMFPNPPQELFGESEIIRLQYEFHLELRSRLFEILPWTV